LIVIVILGVLAAAIIPNLSKFVSSGQLGSANAELASVRTGIAAYQADHDAGLPTATPLTGGVVLSDLIIPYIQGSNGIKAVYTVSAAGLITTANPAIVNQTLLPVPTPWGVTVVVWGTDKWAKP